VRPKITETTAFGVALMAGIAAGFFKSREEIKKIIAAEHVFEPQMDDEKRNGLLQGWYDAVSRALMHPEV